MSVAGAKAMRRRKVEQEFRQHAREVVEQVAAQFQPVYERAIHRAEVAEQRAAVLQTAVERVALAHVDDAQAEARRVLDELGIVPDITTDEASS